ncbi:MAG: TolC family protein [Xanthomonadaceae bacterium]|nr:TolC family protein [Xanthomonadaceae bacterium]
MASLSSTLTSRIILTRGIVVVVLSFFAAHFSYAAVDKKTLTPDQYLEQVKKSNQAYVSFIQASSGGESRSKEERISKTPSFFANATYGDDRSYPTIALPGFNFTSLQTYNITSGFNQNFWFGLQSKLYLNFFSTNYVGLAPQWRIVQPKADLTYPLWSGGFGRTTQARSDLVGAAARASQYQNSFQAKLVLQEAEINYWKLAIATQSYQLQLKGMERAKFLAEWAKSRADRHLSDQSDVYQTQGFYSSKQLELQTAIDDLRAITQTFNSSRNINSTELKETLITIDPDFLSDASLPEAKLKIRDDLRASEQQAIAAQSNATLSAESTKPTLNLVLSGWLNGRDNGSTNGINAWDDLFQANRPSWSASIQFSTPLDLGARADTVRGYELEREASEIAFQRKTFDTEQSWLDMTRKLAEAKHRLKLARQNEEIQAKKAKFEREKFQRARTTTSQVVQFDQDYSSAQLLRLKMQLEILSLVAQLKLFE